MAPTRRTRRPEADPISSAERVRDHVAFGLCSEVTLPCQSLEHLRSLVHGEGGSQGVFGGGQFALPVYGSHEFAFSFPVARPVDGGAPNIYAAISDAVPASYSS